jgi:hypothetical protein
MPLINKKWRIEAVSPTVFFNSITTKGIPFINKITSGRLF